MAALARGSFRAHQGAGRASVRRVTLAVSLIDAAFILFCWLSLGGSDLAGNAISQALTIFVTLVFAVTALPAFALALFGRLPRVALALSLVFLLLLVMPDLVGRAQVIAARL
jgi:hypothetical protein